jgi:hypothetical protein
LPYGGSESEFGGTWSIGHARSLSVTQTSHGPPEPRILAFLTPARREFLRFRALCTLLITTSTAISLLVFELLSSSGIHLDPTPRKAIAAASCHCRLEVAFGTLPLWNAAMLRSAFEPG